MLGMSEEQEGSQCGWSRMRGGESNTIGDKKSRRQVTQDLIGHEHNLQCQQDAGREDDVTCTGKFYN